MGRESDSYADGEISSERIYYFDDAIGRMSSVSRSEDDMAGRAEASSDFKANPTSGEKNMECSHPSSFHSTGAIVYRSVL